MCSASDWACTDHQHDPPNHSPHHDRPCSATLDIRVTTMEPLTNLLLLCLFLVGVLLMGYWKLGGGLLSPPARIIRGAEPARWSLRDFIHLQSNRPKSSSTFIFREESIRSLGHRFAGRFDFAILHWEEAPVLDAIVERKFPLKHLPSKPRPEDVFQAGLYALSLMESGVSCSSTRLFLIYCLQEPASRCIGKNGAECLTCGEKAMFVKSFRPERVLRGLRKLDEVWYRGRKPRATPNDSKCKGVPTEEMDHADILLCRQKSNHS
jgi:hypothetical protein